MSNDKQLLEQALEALEFDGFTPEDLTHRSLHAKAITAIRARLDHMEDNLAMVAAQRPVAEPHKWVGLTIDEVFELASTRLPLGLFSKLVEAKLREKNT